VKTSAPLPDYVRPSLLSLGIAGFRVPFWEVESDGRLTPGDRYDRLSVVTYARTITIRCASRGNAG
jgi:hypothetical protein